MDKLTLMVLVECQPNRAVRVPPVGTDFSERRTYCAKCASWMVTEQLRVDAMEVAPPCIRVNLPRVDRLCYFCETPMEFDDGRSDSDHAS